MRSMLINFATAAGAIAIALGWAGLVCLNSGEPDFTEQFWFYGLVALLASHAFTIGVVTIYGGESNA